MVRFALALLALIVAFIIIVAKGAGKLATQEAFFYLFSLFVVYYLMAALLG